MNAPFHHDFGGKRWLAISGGEGSWRAGKIDRARHPKADFGMFFTDTLYEDADTYRFLLESAADILGRPLSRKIVADDFPDYRVSEDVPIEQYAGNPAWRAYLADLRAWAAVELPELVWLVEGRDPWEIFRDEQFLGNSQRDPCSRTAKRRMAEAWRSSTCRREGELFGPPDVFAVGIGFHERHRFDDGEGGGVGPLNAADGWIYHAPLIDAETAVNMGGSEHLAILAAPCEEFGLVCQRLYRQGYLHGNCGGFCCKAGQAHWANRFRVQPVRFAYDAMMERKLRVYIGADVSMLTDRRGGDGKKPLTLDSFAARLRAEPGREYEYRPGESGCGCFGVAA